MKDQPIFIIHSDGTIEQIIESCEDSISRAAAIQSMNKLYEQDCKDYGCEIPECFDSYRAIRELKSLPSVQSKETYNKGWEDGAKAATYHYELCIEEIKTEIKDLHNSHMINFVSANGAVDTCLEIIDKHIAERGAE